MVEVLGTLYSEERVQGMAKRLDARASAVVDLLDELWGQLSAEESTFPEPGSASVRVEDAAAPSSYDPTRPAPPGHLDGTAPEPARARAEIGDIIDGVHRIESKLGEGGMGTVFRATDVRLNRQVAIKVLSRTPWSSPQDLDLFFAEARSMARVRHPNVVAIYAIGEFKERPYIAMELIEGRDLRAVAAERDAPFPLHEAVALADQICQGVSAIHRAGTVHRDLKPSNVLVGPTFRVAITDMGMAIPFEHDARARLGGTLGYTAPEAFSHEDIAFPHRIDVYGVGALVYELLTGRRAFEAEDSRERYVRQCQGRVTPPREVNPEIPASMEAAIVRALAPAPEDRQASINQLREELLASVEHDDFRGATALVVDDDLDVCSEMAKQVRAAIPGARIKNYTSGRNGLRAAQDAPPDLMVVDLHMPGYGGRELIEDLRASAPTHDVPVIVVSGVGTAADWKVLQRIGASGFLMKPTDVTSLAPLCRHLVWAKLQRRRATNGQVGAGD